MAITRYAGDRFVGLNEEKDSLLTKVMDGAIYITTDFDKQFIKKDGSWIRMGGICASGEVQNGMTTYDTGSECLLVESGIRFFGRTSDTGVADEGNYLIVSGNTSLGIYPEVDASGEPVDPQSVLRVIGDLRVEGDYGTLVEADSNITSSLFSVSDSAGLPVFEVFPDDRVVAGRYDQSDFIIDSSGNVGIGVTGEILSKFHFDSDSGKNDELLISAFEGQNAIVNISGTKVTAGPTGPIKTPIKWTVSGDYANSGHLKIRTESGVFVTLTNESGYLGLGTEEPEHTLHVSGDAQVSGYLYDVNNTTGQSGWVLTSESGGPVWRESSAGTIDGSGISGYLSVWEDQDTLGNSPVYQYGSNIGVDTTTVGAKLQVGGNNTLDTAILIDPVTGANNDRRWKFNAKSASDYLEIGSVSNTQIFVLDGANGSVGVGKIPDTNIKLDVEGFIQANKAVNFKNAVRTWQIQGDNAPDYLKFLDTTAGTLPMVIEGGASDYSVHIASGAKVGINTNAPQHAFHVNGDAMISGYLYDSLNTTGQDGWVLTSKSGGSQWQMIEDVLSGVGGSGTANYVPLWQDEDTLTDSVIAQSGVNVGIGTDAPDVKLKIVSSGGSTVSPIAGTSLLAVNNAQASNNSRIGIIGGTTGFSILDMGDSADQNIGGIAYDNNANKLYLRANDNYFLTILSDGKVGIGTQNPSTLLHLSSTSNPTLTFTDTGASNNNTTAGIIQFQALDSDDNNDTFAQIYGNVSNYSSGSEVGQFNFKTMQAGTLDDGMVIKGASVGIGVVPGTILHVKGIDPVFQMEDTSAPGTARIQALNGSLILQSDVSDAVPNSIISFKIDDTEHARFNSNGNLGINTTNPLHKFHVSGDAQISGYLYDYTNSTGQDGYVLTSRSGGPVWEEAGGGTLSGSGVANYSAKWDGETSLTSGIIYDDGTSVGIGTSTLSEALTVNGRVEADEFVGDLRGAVVFKANAGENISKGQAVYISGISGNKTVVSLADADDSSKMPAFGIAAETVSANSDITIVTFGRINNLDTSAYTEGDELFVSTTAGALTDTPPAGESALLQKLAKVTRSDNSAGSMTVMGAGRTNAVPNLNEGKIFVGDSGNQAVADDTVYVDIANSKVGINNTSPQNSLHVSGDGKFDLESGQAVHLDGAGDTYLKVDRGSVSDNDAIISFDSNGTSDFRLGTLNYQQGLHVSGAELELFTIDNYGNVGVKTQKPIDGDLEGSPAVTINGTDPTININSSGQLTGSDGQAGRLRFTANDSIAAAGGTTQGKQLAEISAYYVGATNNGDYDTDLIFKVAEGSNVPAEQLRITSSGQLKLDAYGQSSSIAGDAYRHLAVDSAGYVIQTSNSGTTNFLPRYYNNYGGLDNSVVQQDGNKIGINVAPEHQLHVSGDAIISGYLYDSTNSTGSAGYILSSEAGGPQWKQIEDVLSGVGGSGTANYVPLWQDEDTLTDSVIAQSGNYIGIGSDTPTAKLHVQDDSGLKVHPTTPTDDAHYIRLRHDNSTGTIDANRGDLKLDAQNYVYTLKNFGINATTPSNKLVVINSDTDTTPTALLQNSSTGDASLHFNVSGRSYTIGIDNSDDDKFKIARNNGLGTTDRLTINGDGNVGIGTTGPDTKLHIDAGAILLTDVITYSANQDSAYLIAGTSGYTGATTNWNTFGFQHRFKTSSGGVPRVTIDTSGGEKFYIDNNGRAYINNDVGIGTSPNTSIRLLVSGNMRVTTSAHLATTSGSVGIGSTAPTEKLFVLQGTVNSTIARFTGANTDRGLVIGTAVSGITNDSIIEYDAVSTNSVGQHAFKTDGTERVRISADGNVGIGTTSPTSTLNISDSTAGASVLKVDGSSGTIFEVTDDLSNSLMSVNTIAGLPVFEVFADYHIVAGRYNQNDFYLDTNGNLGLGTGTPVFKLDVVGASRIYEDTATAVNNVGVGLTIENDGAGDAVIQFLLSASTRWMAGIDNSDSDKFKIASSANFNNDTNLTIQTDGKVGIGTVSPGNTLHIYNNATIGAIGSITTANAGLRIQDSSTNMYIDGNSIIMDTTGYITTTGSQDLGFGTNSTYRLWLDRNGSVGIGTTDPAAKLHINRDDTTRTDLILENNRDVATSEIGAIQYKALNDAAESQLYSQIVGVIDNPVSGSEQGRIAFETAISGVVATRMTIDGANVGIGNGNPDKLFVVQGDNAEVVINDTDGNPSPLLRFRENGTTSATIRTDTDLIFSVATDEEMRLTDDGKLGIGVDPAYELHVNGDAIISGYLYDSTNSTGVAGYVLASQAGGPQWQSIEDVLSGVGGGGTTNYIPKWDDPDTLGDSVIAQSGVNIGIGKADPTARLDVKENIIVRDTDSDLEHIQLFSNSTEGVMRLRNGANWGFIARGSANNPYIGAYSGGSLNIVGFTSSNGSSFNSTLAQFNFSTQRVGIGLQSPYGKLEVALSPTTSSTTVNETADFADKFVISNSGTSANGDRIPLVFNVGGAGGDNISAAIVGEREASGWNSALSFWVNNVTSGSEGTDAIQERMRINSDGYVGIGTDDPDLQLHVKSSSGNSNLLLQRESFTSWQISAGSTYLTFLQYGGSELLRIQNTGKVGIGTTTPNTKLHVYDSIGGTTQRNVPIDVLTLETEHTGSVEYNGFGQGIVFRGSTYNNTTQRTIGRILHQINDDSNNTTRGTSMSFQTLDNATATSPTTKLHIDYDGNVGIGTTSPAGKLDIQGSTNSSLILTRTSSGIVSNIEDSSGYGALALYQAGGGVKAYIAANADSYLLGGGLAIGATSTSFQLEIQDDTDPTIRIQDNTNNSRLDLRAEDSSVLIRSTSNYPMRFDVNQTERMRIDTSGNVGIGTDDPSEKLHLYASLSGAPNLVLQSNASAGQEGGGILFKNTANYYDLASIKVDTDTYTNRGDLVFATANTSTPIEAVRILGANQNVGIGTNSPSYKLHVNGGGARIEDGETTLSPDSTSNSGISTRALTIMNLVDTGWTTDALTAYNATTSYDILNRASYSFFARPQSTNIITHCTEVNDNAHLYRFVNLNSSATEPLLRWYFYQYDGSGTTSGDFKTASKLFEIQHNGSTQLMVQGDGNVGIGTTSPGYKLDVVTPALGAIHVKSTAQTHGLLMGSAAYSAGDSYVGLKTTAMTGSNDYMIISGGGDKNTYVSAAANMAVHIRGGGNDTTNEIIVTDSGNNTYKAGGYHYFQTGSVGIGGNPGTAKLYVLGGSSSQTFSTGADELVVEGSDHAGISILAAAAKRAQLYFNTDAFLRWVDNDGVLSIDTSSSSSKIALGPSGANVGIGTTAPGTTKLRVVNGASGQEIFKADDGATAVIRAKVDGTVSFEKGITLAGRASALNTGSKLQVDNAIALGSSTYTFSQVIGGADLQLISNANPANLGVNSNIIFKLGTSGGGGPVERMRIVSDGSIDFNSYGSGTFTGTSAYYLTVDSSGNVIEELISSGTPTGSGTTNYIPKWDGAVSLTDSVIYEDSGNIGIGTTSAQPYSSLFPGKLVIDTGTAQADGIFSTTNHTNAAELVLTKKNSTNNFGSLVIQHAGTAGNAIAVNHSVNTTTGSGGTNSFRVTTGGEGYFAGSVGIGIASPAQTLHLYGSSANLRLDRDNTGYGASLEFNQQGNNKWTLKGGQTSGAWDFAIRSATGTERLTILQDGNVGIGTTSPDTKLDVGAGSIRLDAGYNLEWGSGYAGGGPTIWGHSAGKLRFAPSGNSSGIVMELTNTDSYIDSNVGIGTTSPSSTLHVVDGTSGASVLKVDGSSGTIFEVTDDLSSSLMSVNTIAGLPVFEVFADYHIVAGRYNQNDFYLDTNGNLGLGTGSPSSKLDVVGDEADIYLRSADYDLVRIINRGTGSNLDKGLISVFDTGVEDVRIDSAGNSWFDGGAVGIGTTNPALTLHVNNADGSDNSRFSRGGSYIFDLKIDNIITNSAIDYIIEPAQASSGLLFRSRNSSNTNVNALAINRDGKVGIGITDPLAPLHVQSTQTTGQYAIRIKAADGSDLGGFYEDTQGNGEFYVKDASGTIGVRLDSNGDTYFTGGSVGIGTTSPTHGLTLGDISSSPTTGRELVFYRQSNDISTGYDSTLAIYSKTNSFGTYEGAHFRARGFKFQRHDGSQEYLSINNDGNVGIGTADGDYNLDIVGSGGADDRVFLRVKSNASSGDGDAILYLDSAQAGESDIDLMHDGSLNWRIRTGDAAGSTNTNLNIQNASANNVLTLEQIGYVGIGTNNPGTTLHVYKDSASSLEVLFENDGAGQSGLTLRSDRGSNGNLIGFVYFDGNDNGSNNTRYNSIESYIVDSSNGTEDGRLTFSSMVAGADTEILHVTGFEGEGRVGIGTTTPSSKLHVNGGSKYLGGGDWTTIERVTSTEGNYALYVQTTGSNTNQAIAKFNYGATQGTANSGTGTAVIARQTSYFTSQLRIYGSTSVSGSVYGAFLGTYSGGTSISPGELVLATQAKTGWGPGDELGRIRFYLGDSSGVGTRDVAKIVAVNEDGDGSATTTASGALAFYTSAYNSASLLERLRIDQSGKVGINTDNPTAKFQINDDYTTDSYGDGDLYVKNSTARSSYDPDVQNTTDLQALITVSSNNTTGPDKPGLILHNDDNTAGGFSPMLLFSKRETGSTDFKATMAGIYARSPLGTGNSASWIDGELIFATAGAASQGITQRMVINKEGLVGIGTTNPGFKLDVEGDIRIANGGLLRLYTSGGTARGYIQATDTANQHLIIATSGGEDIAFKDGGTGGTTNMLIQGDGNVGIGTPTPDVKLEVVVASPTDGIIADFVNATSAGGTTAAIKLSNADSEACDVVLGANRVGANFGSDFFISLSDGTDGTNQERFRITEAGKVQFNTYGSGTFTGTPAYKLSVDSSGNIIETAVGAGQVDGSGTTGYISIWTDSDTIGNSVIYQQNGNVGVGMTTAPSYKLQVNGSFAATTKSFVIDHPTKPNKKLRYASLEGPENGVYVRGKGDSNVIELPEYWTELVHEESITVNLTAIGRDSNKKIRAYSVDNIEDNKVYIYTDSSDNIYNYFFTVYGERKDVERLEVEVD